MKIKALCKNCNKEFTFNSWRPRQFCSNECRGIYSRKPLKKQICPICGKEFKIKPYHYKTYCSKKCRNIGNRVEHEIVVCLNCGKEFDARKSDSRKFCSYKCASEQLRSKNHHAYNLEDRKRICEYCGKEYVVDYVNSPQRFCSNKCNGFAMMLSDIYAKGYPKDWTEELRTKIRKRDLFVCQLCGLDGYSVHHIDYDKMNCEEENLITLCVGCHMKTNYNRETWKKYFIELMRMKGEKND